MAKNLALTFLALAAPLILVSFLSESEGALWLFSFLTMAFPIALIVAAVESPARLRVLWPTLLALGVVLELSGTGMLAFSRGATTATLFGLPLAAISMLAGLWLAPLAIITWAYPRSFERVVLSRAALERLRARRDTGA